MLQMGWMGVDLFFVISGFLITSVLQETQASPHYFRNFFVRRTLRIWPLYYANLLVFFAAIQLFVALVPPEISALADKQVWFWLYAGNWLFAFEGDFTHTPGGYLWSLVVEEQFYLIWPFVLWKISDRRLAALCVALLGMSLSARLILANVGYSTGTLYTATSTHIDALVVGSFLAVAWKFPEHRASVMRSARWLVLAALGGMVAVRASDNALTFSEPAMARYGYSLIAIIGGALLLHVYFARESTWLGRFFRAAPMVLTGRYSYALYLTHVPAGIKLDQWFWALKQGAATSVAYDGWFTLQLVSAVAISWCASMASWHLFEKHILKLKRFFDCFDEFGIP